MQEYNGCLITTDKEMMKLYDIHQWLPHEAYWCKDIPLAVVKKSFDNSFCIGAIREGRQIAYARLITDYATFGYLADVYVAEEYRSAGISKKMLELLFDLDWVKGLRSVKLATWDAPELYRKYGFVECSNPERLMEITKTDLYAYPLQGSKLI